MIDARTQQGLSEEFARHRGVYEDFASELNRLARALIAGTGCVVHSISGRCKSTDSLTRKLSLPGKAYTTLADITDLTGLRVTTYFAEDVDAIASILEREFTIDRENSVDKRKSIDPDRFGYQSLHYVATLSEARARLAEYRRFKDLKFEVQVRSILQHAWAEIEHDLGYKSVAGVPRDVRRRFARVAGLLELADAEFCGIRNQLADYAVSVGEQIEQSAEDTELDLVSIRAVYGKTNSPLRRLDEIVVARAESRLTGSAENVQNVEEEIEWLQRLGISTVKNLEDAIASEQPTLENFVDYWLEGETYPELEVGIGLFYLLFLILRRKKSLDLIKEYCQSRMFGEPDAVAERLLAYKPVQ